MYFTSAGGYHQMKDSPRRSSGRIGGGTTSPIHTQFAQYRSFFQQQHQQSQENQQYDKQTPPDKARKSHQHQHFRSSSSNPIGRIEGGQGQGLAMYGSSSLAGGSVASLSPFHAPVTAGINNLVAVGTKTKSLSLLIDRSGGNGPGQDYPYISKKNAIDPRISSSMGVAYNHDQPLNRQHQDRGSTRQRDYYTIGSRWDRSSADREYPYSFSEGARSLEREQQLRAQSFEGAGFYREEDSPSPAFYSNESQIPSRDGFVLDLQAQIAELNKECAVLQQELDLAKEKLNSTMNSIKTFWSPELKKERSLRKEENLKYSSLSEQLKSVEIENRQHLTSLMKLEQENRSLKDTLRSSSTSLPQPFITSTTSTGTGVGEFGSPSAEVFLLRKEKEKFMKESKLLRKTIDEMELRIETQQKTLSTRDETIKKLMELLQQTKARGTLAGDSFGTSQPLTADQDARQQDIDLSSAREEIQRLKEESEVKGNHLESSRAHEKVLKEKLEAVKQELSRRESESASLQTRVDTLQRHWDDHEKHISVLREQISSKEQQIKMLHADVEMLRDRLKEREESMEKKSRQVAVLQNEKTKMNLDTSGLKDTLDETNAKLISQQRKIESLEEDLKEKDLHLASMKMQLASLQLDHTSSDKALINLQEMIADKDKQIEKMKEQRERMQKQIESEERLSSEKLSDLRSRIAQFQDEIIAKQENELTLKEEIGYFKSEVSSKDALISNMLFEENENKEIIEDLKIKLKKAKDELSEISKGSISDADKCLSSARVEIEASRAEIAAARYDLQKLVMLKESNEKELNEKNLRLAQLETEVLKLRSGGHVKDNEGAEDDANVFKSILLEKDGRIEELETALRESIKITAQREVVMAEQQMKLEHTERLMESMQEELDNTKKSVEDTREQLFRSSQQVKEKDDLLKEHLNDSKKQLSEVYEMKQEAILAAISEKDAHIALLEMAPNKKTENIMEVEKLTKEKLKLQQVLRDLTQSRMKLLQSRGHMRSSSASSLLHYATYRDAEDDGTP